MKKLFLFLPLLLALVACSNDSPELPGVFSVAKDKKVQFSPGVLKYKASTNTWRFADSQLDVIGEGNMNISPTYNGWIDLFGYGCTGYNDKYPWQYSNSPADYAPSRNEGITGSEYDWGTYCDIQNGGPKGSWHLMESYNWYYLLEKRPNATNLVTFIYVDDIQGLAIFPDEWENTTGVSVGFDPNGITIAAKEIVEGNHFTKSQWKKLEKSGAVFMPAVGWRVGQKMSYSSDGVPRPRYYSERSYYWCGNVLYDGAEPWVLEVLYGSVLYHEITYFGNSRSSSSNQGFFVRLVKDVK